MGKSFAEYYLSAYPGNKGESLASKAEADYGRLADDYTAYYNYDLGYQRMENVLFSYYYTLAVLMVAGLAGIFSCISIYKVALVFYLWKRLVLHRKP